MRSTAGKVPPSCSSLHSSPCSVCLQAAVKGEALGCALPRPGVKRSYVGMPQTRGLKSPSVGGTWAPGRELLQEGGLWQSQAGARLDSAGGRHWGQQLAGSAKCLPSPHLLGLVPGGRLVITRPSLDRGRSWGCPSCGSCGAGV